ncbi:MAG: outer membrane lipoprotein chaperone LolA [Magnetococcus sp. WYHC-3]
MLEISSCSMPFWRGLCLAVCVAVVPAPVGAAEGVPDELAALQDYLDHSRSLEAGFHQRTLKSDGTPAEDASGHFVATRPGRFDWVYTAPHQQRVVSDGRWVWYYEPELEQVTRTPVQMLEKTPAAILVSSTPLTALFQWSVVPATGGETLPLIHLEPKGEGGFKSLDIRFDPRSAKILDFVVVDHLDNHSRFQFIDMQRNAPVDESRLVFVPPQGVDVLESDGR